MDTIEIIRELTVGSATLRVQSVYDHDDNMSLDYGKGARWRDIQSEDYVYDRKENLFAGPTVLFGGEYRRQWRDSRGRVQTNDDNDDAYAREYRYIVANVENYKGEPPRDIYQYARQNAEYLDRFWRNLWCYIGIVATIVVDGRELGASSVWGIIADDRTNVEKDYASEIRDVSREAIDEAQSFRARLAQHSARRTNE